MAHPLTPERIRERLANERVSLVGGGGFIGHNLALGLRKYGVTTQVIDNLMQNNLVANVSVSDIGPFRRELYHGFLIDRFNMMRRADVVLRNADARNMVDLYEAFREFQPTKIVHLSAIASALEAKKVPGYCFELQLTTLKNVIEYCRLVSKDVNQVCFMSSSTVYGNFETPIVDESTRPRPFGIYANTKYMAERLLRTYNDQYGLGITIIRPSALYGERCISGRVSQKFIENALLGKPLLLEGGGDGRLDFTYIDDLVDGIIRSLAEHPGGNSSNTFNITYGNARTIAELAKVVKEVVPNAILEDRARDVDKPVRGTLSTARAEEVLGFKAQWPLETGYKRYCEWYVEQWQRTKGRLLEPAG
jgi:nucleoside-diphosphate-sugar epimerase